MVRAAPDSVGRGERFSIRLCNDIAAVEVGRRALLAYLENFRLDPMVTNRIEVVLEELVSNVARHAKGAAYVTIKADYGDNAVSMRVEDNGDPYNPLDRAEPPPFTDVATATLGGQGIPLIKRLSRSVCYNRIGNLNRVDVVIAAP